MSKQFSDPHSIKKHFTLINFNHSFEAFLKRGEK